MALLSFISLALAAIFASTATAAPAGPTLQKRALPPSLDPFYDPPAGFESAEPGTIFKNRTVVASFLGTLPVPVETYQLLYRSTAIDGSAIAEVTTIFVPEGAATDRFVSFQTAYDSANTICNPSYQYQLGAIQVTLITAIEQLILQLYLAEGYIVSSSDYEGPDAAFGTGRLAGTGTLDSMRAVRDFSTLGLDDNPMIAGVGYSGGAIATGWAASLQPSYAPELNIRGWAAGGTPANLTGTAVFVDNTIFSGFLPAAIVGLSQPSSYGEALNPLIDRVITPYGRSVLNFAEQNCAPADILAFASQSVFSTRVQSLGFDILYDPVFSPILQQNTMGLFANETPTAPVFLYHASNDEIIPYRNATTLRDSWCDFGADVKFTTYANGGHFSTEILGAVGQVQFANAAFEGTTSSGCSENTVLDNELNPVALGASLEPILTNLLTALTNIGENDETLKNNLNFIEENPME